MLASSYKRLQGRLGRSWNWRFALLLPVWIIVSFSAAQLIVFLGAHSIGLLGLDSITNDSVAQTIVAALVYVLTLLIVIGVPFIIKKRATSRADMGLSRLPSWTDILLAPAGFVVYFIASALILFVVTQVFPSLNVDQAQDVGFNNLARQHEYLLAFLTLVVIAPIAEEMLFRGYLYGKLRRHVPTGVAIVVTSLLFAAVHGQVNLALDTFALSLVLCSLREITGSIWAGILLHMLKNGIAFYLLFIYTAVQGTIGG